MKCRFTLLGQRGADLLTKMSNNSDYVKEVQRLLRDALKKTELMYMTRSRSVFRDALNHEIYMQRENLIGSDLISTTFKYSSFLGKN